MADHVQATPQRGSTYLSGSGRSFDSTTAAEMEGVVRLFSDTDPTAVNGAKSTRSNLKVTCILARNVMGVAAEAKRIVRWKSGYMYKQFDGYTTVDAGDAGGIVDEHLPSAGCPNNDLCWIVVDGPSLIKTGLAADATNVIAVGDRLIALTAATSQSTTAGRIQTWALTATSTQTTDGGLATRLLNVIGRALSAKTTANTNADVLAYVTLLKNQ